MDYSTLAILLALATLVLVVAEFFIPSGGMISILAVIGGVISVWGAWKAWGTTSPVKWWVFLTLFCTIIPGAIAAVVTILPRTQFGKRLLGDPLPAPKHLAHVEEIRKLDSLVGQVGVAATLHTPGGITMIDGRRYHSESEGLLIEPETPVVVIGVRGGARLLVRETSGDPQPNTQNTQNHSADGTSPFLDDGDEAELPPKRNLDFQLPGE
jgi:membrane-bound ClpP family serine protease